MVDEGYELRIEAVPLVDDRRARAVIIQDVPVALPSGGAGKTEVFGQGLSAGQFIKESVGVVK